MSQRLDRIDERLDKIAALNLQTAANVLEHDRQIGALLELAKQQAERMAALERQWQAYLSTIHPRQ